MSFVGIGVPIWVEPRFQGTQFLPVHRSLLEQLGFFLYLTNYCNFSLINTEASHMRLPEFSSLWAVPLTDVSV